MDTSKTFWVQETGYTWIFRPIMQVYIGKIKYTTNGRIHNMDDLFFNSGTMSDWTPIKNEIFARYHDNVLKI